MVNWQTLALRLQSLVVFRGLLRREVPAAFAAFVQSLSGSEAEQVRAYCDLADAVYRSGFDFSRTLLEDAVQDENFYLHLLAKEQPIPQELSDCVERELLLLNEVANLSSEDLCGAIRCEIPLPRFSSGSLDFPAEYHRRTAAVQTQGWGVFAESTMFYFRAGALVPARPADPITVNDLSGYDTQHRLVIENTRSLMAGLPAANLLLYGDAGTGKSSTVKAAANLFAPAGLRLIELKKHQLRQLPELMEQLEDTPLKFILFIDDLSFQRSDDDFNALKAALEGSSCTRASNVVIYVTSNRRHLIRERFSDREGADDIHRRDTVQELLSLSERFGRSVSFSTPNKALYLQIVRDLALRKGITLNVDTLEHRAEAFALEKGGRSPRAAEQFTNCLLAEKCWKEPSSCLP